MTVFSGVGQSEYSETKEQHYAHILGWHMGVACRAMGKWKSDYLMIDATAGTGKLYDCGEIDGSPLVFLRQAFFYLGRQWRAIFCEQNPASFDLLRKNVGSLGNVELCQSDYQSVLSRSFGKNQIGLLYVDENGTPDFAALSGFARRNPLMEILISVTATGVKRGKVTELRLGEWVRQMGKRYWGIRKPYGQWQWTFLFGSDYVGFNKDYRKIDMYPIDSKNGQSFLDVASYTQKELAKKAQPPLLTELMPST